MVSFADLHPKVVIASPFSSKMSSEHRACATRLMSIVEWADRLADKIKWYVQPLIFGENPQSTQNLTWITLDQHIEAVRRRWNTKYRELKGSKASAV